MHRISGMLKKNAMLFLLFSLAGVLLYAYALCAMLLTRQEIPLYCVAACGVIAFALASHAARKRGRRLLCALHGLAALASAALLAALFIM